MVIIIFDFSYEEKKKLTWKALNHICAYTQLFLSLNTFHSIATEFKEGEGERHTDRQIKSTQIICVRSMNLMKSSYLFQIIIIT